MLANVQLEVAQRSSLKVAAGAAKLPRRGVQDSVDPSTVVDKADAVPLCCPCRMVCCDASGCKRAQAPWALICNNKRRHQRDNAMFFSAVRLQCCNCCKSFVTSSALSPCRVHALPVAPEGFENYFRLLHAIRAGFVQGLGAKKASEDTRIKCCPLLPICRAWCKHVQI